MRDSRRARLVLTILLLAAFTLVTLDYRAGALGGVRRAASTVFGPVEGAVSGVTHPIGSWFSAVGHAGSYKDKNTALKQEIAALQNQVRLTAQQRSELSQLRKIDHLAGLAQFTVVHATVNAVGPLGQFEWTATINRGSANGIRPNETVLNGNGLVGRVTTVGRNSATVLLANDPTFAVGARIAGSSGEIGTLTGGGRGDMTFELLDPSKPIAVGDRLVTYGSTNFKPFVPEVPLGHVVRVIPGSTSSVETATVAPYVSYTAVDEVAVVVSAPPSVAKDILLPPKPTPTPTPTVTKTVTESPKPNTSTSSTP
jgi:rod shape-determining protein MreC